MRTDIRSTLTLAASLCALMMAGAAAAEPTAPVELTNEQMDNVVAGVVENAAGVVIVDPDEGVIVLQGVGNSSWPPPTVLVDYGEGFVWVNEAGIDAGP